MPRQVLISVVGMPPPLNVLMRMHHFKQRGTTNEWSETVQWQLKAARRAGEWDGRPFSHAAIVAEFWFPDRRRRDPDGYAASLKGLLDGMVHAGLLVDDDFDHISLTVKRGGVRKRRAGIDITVSEIGEEAS